MRAGDWVVLDKDGTAKPGRDGATRGGIGEACEGFHYLVEKVNNAWEGSSPPELILKGIGSVCASQFKVIEKVIEIPESQAEWF